MKVDIYIRERDGGREIRIPWLPETIEYDSGGTTVATYDIMDKGEVAVPTGSGLAKISWSGVFPGRYRTDKSMNRGTPKKPQYYHKILNSWKEEGTALNLMVTGYPINEDVILKTYSAKPSGGFGDLEYTVSFVQDRDIVIKSKTVTVATDNATNTERPAQTTTSYTIKSGDTLWKISQKFLGAGAKWQSIYDANSTIIEETAKKYGKKSSNNGWWIYPGCTISSPQ